jgi:hypothetical protein
MGDFLLMLIAIVDLFGSVLESFRDKRRKRRSSAV